ncbi:MAG: hypothetical protein RIC95_11110 [Vicingaceae bacterium]
MASTERRIDNKYGEQYELLKSLAFADIYLNKKDGILLVYYYPDTEIDASKAQVIINSVDPIISAHNLLYGMTDAREENLNITREARSLYSDNPTLKLSKRHAVIVNQLTTRMLANFFVKIDQPVIPTKVFNSLSAAEKWLISN